MSDGKYGPTPFGTARDFCRWGGGVCLSPLARQQGLSTKTEKSVLSLFGFSGGPPLARQH